MAGRSAFVTGAYGLLGGALVRALLDRGDRVTVLRRDRTARSSLSMLGLEGRVNVVEGDVCDAAVLERTLGEYDVELVFHLAAQAIVPTANASPVPTFDANVRGTWTLMDAVRRHGPVRTVVASSDKAYGAHAELPYREDFALRATYPYDVSKAATDLIARSYWHTFEVPVAVTRFANLYGPADLHPSRLIPEVILAALSGRAPVIRSDGTPERDFLFTDDAAAAYLAISDALEAPDARGEAFNAGSGRPTSILEVVSLICRLTGRDVEPDVRGSGTPSGEIDRQYVDTTKIREVCGWEPKFDLESGLAATIEWYRQHLDELTAQPSA